MAFTVELGAVVVTCGRCGRRYDLNGTLRVVAPTTGAVLDDIEVPFEGPCTGCAPPHGGGEELPEVTAAE
jgi:hypothetical protein